MKHDERLVEAVARGIVKRRGDDPDRLIPEEGDDCPLWIYFTDDAAAALNAINASGIAWVAPWYSTEAMLEFEAEHTWAMIRDAYLAEQASDPMNGEREAAIEAAHRPQ